MGRKTQQNSICTPELLAQVNPKNKQLVNDFLSYLKSVQRSETTIFGYTNDLEIWQVWNLQNNDDKFFCDMSKRNMVAYQDWLLNTNGNSPARVRRLRSALSSLGNYVESVLDDEYPMFRNFINKIPAPAANVAREKTVLTDEQIDSLLQHLVETKNYQKACWLALGIYSGARKAELVRFKIDFFKDENVIFGSLWKTPKIKTKGRGAGKFIPKYVLKKEFEPYLNLWLNERSVLGIDSEWLFVTKNADETWSQMKAETANSWAESFSNILGVPFYAHAMRHFWCTAMARKGIPSNVIKSLQNWESESMVSLYSDIDDEELFGKYFDENGVKEVKQKSITEL